MTSRLRRVIHLFKKPNGSNTEGLSLCVTWCGRTVRTMSCTIGVRVVTCQACKDAHGRTLAELEIYATLATQQPEHCGRCGVIYPFGQVHDCPHGAAK